MTLKIGWLHEAEQSRGTWLHQADDWHIRGAGSLNSFRRRRPRAEGAQPAETLTKAPPQRAQGGGGPNTEMNFGGESASATRTSRRQIPKRTLLTRATAKSKAQYQRARTNGQWAVC